VVIEPVQWQTADGEVLARACSILSCPWREPTGDPVSPRIVRPRWNGSVERSGGIEAQ
jgi:hypothetical protein